MKNLLVITAACFFFLASTDLGHAQDSTPSDCKQTIEKSCTSCHGAGKICKKLESPDANWPNIVSGMGKKANLNQETQDAVLKCFANPTETAKLLCEKK